MTTWADVGIHMSSGTTGEVRTTCPQCSPSRHKSRDTCLAVNVDQGTWLCHHCGWKGGLHGRSHVGGLLSAPRPPAQPDERKPAACADAAALDVVYRALLAALPLSPPHHQALRQRGLGDGEILRRRYRTLPLPGRAALAKRLVDQCGAEVCAQVPGVYVAERDGRRWWSIAGAAGLVIPVRSMQGQIVALKVRADDPGDRSKYTTMSSAKYGGPGPGAPLHVSLFDGVRGDTARLTEGELKSDVTTVLSGLLTISVPGVGMWRKALPVLQALGSKHVLLAFDADWRTNIHVAQALAAVIQALVATGYGVEVESWDPRHGKGIDNVYAAGHRPTGHAAVPWLHWARTVPSASTRPSFARRTVEVG